MNGWPAKSPYLNPSEQLWDNLDQHVRGLPILPSNISQLGQALIQEWNNILQAEINTFTGSIGQQCQAVPHAEGGHIQY